MNVTKLVKGSLAVGVLCASTSLTAIAVADEMPPLPESIEEQGVVRIGTKCDYPPDGYLNTDGEPIGLEVNMGKQIAAYAFGDEGAAEITCVTSSNRVPALVGGKIDAIIATMGINAQRAEVVDFSRPYTWSSSSILVMNDSDIQTMDDLEGRTVAFVKGAWQIPWFEENMPNINDVRLDTVSDSIQSLMQGRADAYAHDLAVQLSLDMNNDRIRMLEDRYQLGSRGVAVRKGEEDWLAYVDASIDRMEAEGKFEEWIEEYEDPDMVEVRKTLWDVSQRPAED
ncbi:transporter substrate-binding domain-containing protein [Aquibaculum sediminis]|uniref:transporter substrate-binding domain-containing protein n=1 Tax=Aquibaculum sediminis TaxID=3231907 RepID=UPI003455C2D0